MNTGIKPKRFLRISESLRNQRIRMKMDSRLRHAGMTPRSAGLPTQITRNA
jgi:hypothetical protein